MYFLFFLLQNNQITFFISEPKRSLIAGNVGGFADGLIWLVDFLGCDDVGMLASNLDHKLFYLFKQKKCHYFFFFSLNKNSMHKQKINCLF